MIHRVSRMYPSNSSFLFGLAFRIGTAFPSLPSSFTLPSNCVHIRYHGLSRQAKQGVYSLPSPQNKGVPKPCSDEFFLLRCHSAIKRNLHARSVPGPVESASATGISWISCSKTKRIMLGPGSVPGKLASLRARVLLVSRGCLPHPRHRLNIRRVASS